MTTTIDTTVLKLPAMLDADTASGLIADMSNLSHDTDIRLDAAAVKAISPGYLQVLISAFKTFPQLRVANASPEFADAFASYGIDYPIAAEVEVALEPADIGVEPAVAIPDSIENAASGDHPEATLVPEDTAQADSALDPPVAAPAPKIILTIDDSRTMRDMLKMALGGAGFTVVQAVDGQDGLNVLAKQSVDLIITDINMPKLDGYGVIRAVRSDPQRNATPILVLSTESEQESKDIAKDAGATGWIVKPFDPDGLVDLVNRVCG